MYPGKLLTNRKIMPYVILTKALQIKHLRTWQNDITFKVLNNSMRNHPLKILFLLLNFFSVGTLLLYRCFSFSYHNFIIYNNLC